MFEFGKAKKQRLLEKAAITTAEVKNEADLNTILEAIVEVKIAIENLTEAMTSIKGSGKNSFKLW